MFQRQPPRSPSRRPFLRWLRRLAALSVAAIALGVAGGVWWWVTSPLDTIGAVAFERPLHIPPLAESTVDGDGTRVFELTAQQGTTPLHPDGVAKTWGFNGSYLGPTLRAEVGEKVKVEVRNELDETTTVHWHGMHLPADMDGGPHQPIEPGESWSPTWKIDQNAATLWYHPHPHGETEKHVYRGLAGMFILDDPDDPVADILPHEYGVDDVPVIVQDKTFDDAGRLENSGFGDTIVVNGTYGPYLDVTTQAVRLRLLNASTVRVYEFGFSDDREYAVIASDGGLLPEPVRTDRLRLSPGERAEIVVRLDPGEETVLRSYRPDLGMDAFTGSFVGGRDRFDVLQLRAAPTLSVSPGVPDELAPAPDLTDADGEPDRRFTLQGTRINDRAMDMNRVDETVEVDTTEIWEVQNTDGTFHNFHVHDVQFQVLTVDGNRPPPELAGWKDTVLVTPGQQVHLALRFTDYTDPGTPYMFHCHLLQHEDHGMMGQFVVVEPGDTAEDPPEHDMTEHDHTP